MPIAAPCASGASDGPGNHPRNRVCVSVCDVPGWFECVGWCVNNLGEKEIAQCIQWIAMPANQEQRNAAGIALMHTFRGLVGRVAELEVELAMQKAKSDKGGGN